MHVLLRLWDQDLFKQLVVHIFQQTRGSSFKVKSGFYTDKMMEEDLKFTAWPKLHLFSVASVSCPSMSSLTCPQTKGAPKGGQEVLPAKGEPEDPYHDTRWHVNCFTCYVACVS